MTDKEYLRRFTVNDQSAMAGFYDRVYPQFVSYDTSTKKISPMTQPDSGADTSGGLSLDFFSKIAEWIRAFLQKILAIFTGLAN